MTISKRLFLAVVPAVLVLVLGMTQVAMAVKELNIWVFSGQEAAKYGEALNRIFAQFEKEHPDFRVKLSTTPYTEYLDRIITAVRGGMGPDIIQNDVIWTPPLAQQGLVLNLDKYWATAPFKEEDFFEASIRTCRWNGSLYGVPQMDGHWGLIFYNKDLMAEAGFSPDFPPITYWDEFIEVAQALTRPDEEQYGYAVMGAMDEGISATWTGWYATTGAKSWLNEDKTRAVVNQANGVRAAKFKTDLALVHKVSPPGVANWDQWDNRSLFETGKLAMYMVGTWEIDILKEEAPDINFSFTYLPRPRNGVKGSMYGGWNWSINVNSKYPDAAWEFIEMATTIDNQDAISSLPPALVAAAKRRFATWERGYVALEQILGSIPRPVHPSYPEMSRAMQIGIQSILLEEKSVEEAMDWVTAEIDKILAR
jgi:multiple sugar transport system substrate-binding protein